MMIEKLITDSFVNSCPIEMSGSKEIISRMLIFAITDILLKHSDEEDLLRELRPLICYHYLGLDGLKEGGADV